MTSHQRSSELALEEPNPISFCYLQKITRKAISSVTEHNETLDRETTLIIVLYRERYPPPPQVFDIASDRADYQAPNEVVNYY